MSARSQESLRYVFSTPTKHRQPKTPPKSPPSCKITCTKDILTVDAIIKSIFRKKVEELPQVDEHISSLEDIEQYSTDLGDRRKAREMRQALLVDRKLLSSGLGLSLYSAKTSQILTSYRNLSPRINLTSSEVQETTGPTRESLVMAYLTTARQAAMHIVTLEIPKDILQPSGRCPECESPNTSIEDGHYVCEGCHTTTPIFDDSTASDPNVAGGARYTYTPRVHMKDAIEKFSCAVGNVSHEVIEGVRNAMRNHNLTPETVTKNFIYAHLTDSKKTEAYSQINFIYCEITHKPPPDIERYTEELLEMSDQFEIAFKTVEPDRSNSMTVLWKLYMFLRLLDFPCSREDFYCLKIPEKQEDREYDWSRTVDVLMKTHPRVMTSNGKKRWRHLSDTQGISGFFATQESLIRGRKVQTGKT